ncbi:hypothetical protein GCM10023178_21480 [Actinomadura luteofluorescens]
MGKIGRERRDPLPPQVLQLLSAIGYGDPGVHFRVAARSTLVVARVHADDQMAGAGLRHRGLSELDGDGLAGRKASQATERVTHSGVVVAGDRHLEHAHHP